MPRTGRQIAMERLNKAIQTAVTGDLQRAAMFLERARKLGQVAQSSVPNPVVLRQMRGKRRSILQLRGSVVVVV